MTDEVRGLLDQFAGIETRERSVLAEVIHDEPIQLIVAAILRIDLLHAHSTDADAEQLDEIASLLESSVDRLRRLIVALSPPDLSDGLGGALRVLADGIFAQQSTRFDITGQMHVQLAIPAMQNVFRIFREAMVNARQHSDAKNVTLHLDQRESFVVVTLTDDGIGSDALDADLGDKRHLDDAGQSQGCRREVAHRQPVGSRHDRRTDHATCTATDGAVSASPGGSVR